MIIKGGLLWMLIKGEVDGARDGTGKEDGDRLY